MPPVGETESTSPQQFALGIRVTSGGSSYNKRPPMSPGAVEGAETNPEVRGMGSGGRGMEEGWSEGTQCQGLEFLRPMTYV